MLAPRDGGVVGARLWPAARVWPVTQGDELVLEHEPLAPGADYRLDLAWENGDSASVSFRTEPELGVVARGPGAGRIDAAAAVWARFGTEVDRASVEASFQIEPKVEGRFLWGDDRSVRFLPSKLAFGTQYQVSIGGKATSGEPLAPASWSFRTLIPPPLKIVPGEGAPVVFTFDDGTRDAIQAIELLDLLKKHDVPSIFFPTGRWARSHPSLIARMEKEGHLICNHSETHPNLSKLPDELIEREIRGGAGVGQCNLLRPPSMGTSRRVERVAASLGYRIYLWDVDSRDWEGLEPEDITNRVLARVKPGAVLLFHMHGAGTQAALPKLFAALRRAGYRLTYEGAPGSPTPPPDSRPPPEEE